LDDDTENHGRALCTRQNDFTHITALHLSFKPTCPQDLLLAAGNYSIAPPALSRHTPFNITQKHGFLDFHLLPQLLIIYSSFCLDFHSTYNTFL